MNLAGDLPAERRIPGAQSGGGLLTLTGAFVLFSGGLTPGRAGR